MDNNNWPRQAAWLALLTLSLPMAHAGAPCDGSQCALRLVVTSTPEFSEAPLSALRELTLGARAQVLDGDHPGLVSNLGSLTTLGPGASVGGAFTAGDLHVGDLARAGSVIYARAVLPETRQAERARRKKPGVDTQSMEWSVRFLSPAQPSVISVPGTTIQVAPAYYRELKVNAKSTATLRTGTYYFDSLTIARGANLRLDTKEGTVVIHVRDDLVHEGAIDYAGTRSDLMLNYFGTRRVELVGKFDGTILAPYATLVVRAAQGPHEGMFHADTLRIDDGAIIRKAQISGRGAAIARLRTQTKEEAREFTNAVSKSDMENDGMPFPDTAAGRILNDAFFAMNGFDAVAEAQYAEAARQLHANAELVMPLLAAQFDRLPQTLETQVRRLTLVEMMRLTSHEAAFEPLLAIARSPTDPGLSAMQQDDHARPTMYEDIIRARAVSGLGEVARTGSAEATNALLDFAVHGTGMQQQYAAREYLASGDREAHRAILKGRLPADLQYLASQEAVR
jgi:hypothetical protein